RRLPSKAGYGFRAGRNRAAGGLPSHVRPSLRDRWQLVKATPLPPAVPAAARWTPVALRDEPSGSSAGTQLSVTPEGGRSPRPRRTAHARTGIDQDRSAGKLKLSLRSSKADRHPFSPRLTAHGELSNF